jgi:hypothetical protein
MSEAIRGLYQKFQVRRTDGSSESGGKHEGCEYFVLDLTHDKFASPALAAYEVACRKEYPVLAQDLRRKLMAAPTPTEAAPDYESSAFHRIADDGIRGRVPATRVLASKSEAATVSMTPEEVAHKYSVVDMSETLVLRFEKAVAAIREYSAQQEGKSDNPVYDLPCGHETPVGGIKDGEVVAYCAVCKIAELEDRVRELERTKANAVDEMGVAIAAQVSAEHLNTVLLDALEVARTTICGCRMKFSDYVDIHTAKGTEDSYKKALANQQMVEYCSGAKEKVDAAIALAKKGGRE